SENALRGSNVIPVHTSEQIEFARKAGRLGREVLDIAAAALKPGVTGDDIDKVVHAACMERGIYPSPLNYCGFPKSVCVSSNEVICHGIPDTRPIEEGELVNLDVSIYTPDGFHADLNETYCVGKVDASGQKLLRCAYDCLRAAIAVCKPGVMYRDLGSVITRVAHESGFTVVKSYCGHGIGQLFHGAPNVPHYAKNKAVGIMRPGYAHCHARVLRRTGSRQRPPRHSALCRTLPVSCSHIFTIEPMINEGSGGDELWPDKWTVVTTDGKRSAQFEHMLLVTETGVEVLTARVGASRTGIVWDEKAVQAPLVLPPSAASGDAVPAEATAGAGATSS
ncbi:type I methionyl aminopeptidase, partial [archaeon]